MNEIKINVNVTKTTCQKSFRVEGAAPLPVKFVDRMIRPERVRVTYQYKPETLVWICLEVEVHGHQVLKPASDGSARIGKNDHKTRWHGSGDRDLLVSSDSAGMPQWLEDAVNKHRPWGHVA